MLAAGFAADTCRDAHRATIVETTIAVILQWQNGNPDDITTLAQHMHEVGCALSPKP